MCLLSAYPCPHCNQTLLITDTYLLPLCTADGSQTSGLSVVIPMWLEHAADVTGDLDTKHCAAALLRLLELRHSPGLARLTVKGEPVAAEGGVRTRAQARQQGGLQYSQVMAINIKANVVVVDRLLSDCA